MVTRGVRRRTIWATWIVTDIAIAAAATSRISIRTLIQAQRPGLGEYTIIRTIGRVQWFDGVAVTTTRGSVFAGMITASSNITVTEIPQPFSETEADWMWWRQGTFPRSDRDIPNTLDWEFDVASQRKQRELERDWSIVVDNRTGEALSFSSSGRSLLKL